MLLVEAHISRFTYLLRKQQAAAGSRQAEMKRVKMRRRRLNESPLNINFELFLHFLLFDLFPSHYCYRHLHHICR